MTRRGCVEGEIAHRGSLNRSSKCDMSKEMSNGFGSFSLPRAPEMCTGFPDRISQLWKSEKQKTFWPVTEIKAHLLFSPQTRLLFFSFYIKSTCTFRFKMANKPRLLKRTGLNILSCTWAEVSVDKRIISLQQWSTVTRHVCLSDCTNLKACLVHIHAFVSPQQKYLIFLLHLRSGRATVNTTRGTGIFG